FGAVSEDGAPAAGTGIAGAGAVGVDDDLAHACNPYSRASRMRRWKLSFFWYSAGSFGRTSAPGGTFSQSMVRVSRKRSAAPRASTGSAAISFASSLRTAL